MAKKREKIIAYKATDSDQRCRGFLFEVGKTYTQEGELKLYENGFHFCRKISNCFDYYSFSEETRILEIEVIGEYIGDINDKECTNKLKIIRQLSWEEVLMLCNSGNRNSGNRNSGNWNSGDRNSGNRNSGNWNSGTWNSGDRNSGNSNSGTWNSGDSNSGGCNSGNCNSGNRNSGNWNSGNWNSGIFNTTNPDKYRVFGKWISKEKYDKIEFPSFLYFDLTQWVSHDTATQQEKEKYKIEIETCGGFLKSLSYKEAFKRSWDNANKEDRIKIKAIPGFDKSMFYEISGIDVDKD